MTHGLSIAIRNETLRSRRLRTRKPAFEHIERLESRWLLSVTATGTDFSAVEGAPFTATEVATFSDTDATVPLSSLQATIDWGDGSTSPAMLIVQTPPTTY